MTFIYKKHVSLTTTEADDDNRTSPAIGIALKMLAAVNIIPLFDYINFANTFSNQVYTAAQNAFTRIYRMQLHILLFAPSLLMATPHGWNALPRMMR